MRTDTNPERMYQGKKSRQIIGCNKEYFRLSVQKIVNKYIWKYQSDMQQFVVAIKEQTKQNQTGYEKIHVVLNQKTKAMH